MKQRHFTLIILSLILLQLTACNNQKFVETISDSQSQNQLHSFDSINTVKIKSFRLTYNPKSNGYIKLELEDGKAYEAKSVDGGSFSSINSLLKEQNVLFDTLRREVVFNKDFPN